MDSEADVGAGNVWSGLLPKEETQALQFVRQNPTFDGRGVVVGIMDTGVDPGAIGLQTTSHGLPKVVDIIDCTGSGDVVMSEPMKVQEDGYLPLTSLTASGGSSSSRFPLRIKVNPNWKNPSGLYRAAVKVVYELYPGGLKGRVKKVRDEQWAAAQRKVATELQAQIQAVTDSTAPKHADLEDLQLQLAQLKALDSSGGSSNGDADDVGPVYPVVTFHDGERYVACVDTGLQPQEHLGDMSHLQPMQEFHVSREYRQFSPLCSLNYGIHIYDDGAICSIVTDTGAHGTHVSGIVAAYHPDQAELNGVAPGAQIVSLKIGDTRLGSMETGAGLVRGLLAAKRAGCHVINMSYGEATSEEEQGIFLRLAEEIVNRHGIIFVASAGNNGPCLSTVGCPGAAARSIISVGAYVTQSLMVTAYNMPTANKETNYTWSSVGPSLDGGKGVTIVAPGGAVTCVPAWTLHRNQLMNGTSMSSPNAAGCIALLVSAAMGTKRPYSPHSIRRAVENSAKWCEHVDALGQGYGLLQVTSAWETFLRHEAADKVCASSDGQVAVADASSRDRALQQPRLFNDIPIKVTVNSERFSKGIYLRQPYEASIASSFKVELSPMFQPDQFDEHGHYTGAAAGSEDTATSRTTNAERFAFEMRVRLRSSTRRGNHGAGDWVTCPARVLLVHGGKTITVNVDCRGLEEDRVYTEHIRGYLDRGGESEEGAEEEEDGPFLFEIPIVVVRPRVMAAGVNTLHFRRTVLEDSTARYRHFIVPPPGCQFVDCVVTDTRRCHEIKALRPTASKPAALVDCEKSSDDGADETNSVDGDRMVPVCAPDGDTGADDDTSTYVSGVDGGTSTCRAGIGGSDDDDGVTRIMVLHALQTFRGTPYRDNEKQSFMHLAPGTTNVMSWAVTAGVTMELCVGKYWATVGPVECKITLQFRGVEVSPSALLLPAGCRVSPKLRVTSTLRQTVDVAPSGKLDKWQSVIPPSFAGVVRPLIADVRDCMDGWENGMGRSGCVLHHMELDYWFDTAEGANADVTVRFPGTQGILYESQFHGQFVKLFDMTVKPNGSAGAVWCGRRCTAVNDAFPDKFKLPTPSKGRYLLRLQLRHENAAVLAGLAEMPMVLERGLKSPISLVFCKTQSDALSPAGEGASGTRGLICGGSLSMFVKEPTIDSLPKGVAPGDTLLGSASFLRKAESSTLGSGTKPGGYNVVYHVGAAVAKAPAAPTAPAAAAAAATPPGAAATTVSADAAAETPTAESKMPDVAAPADAPASSTGSDGADSVDAELQKAIKDATLKHLSSLVAGTTVPAANMQKFLVLQRRLLDEAEAEAAVSVSRGMAAAPDAAGTATAVGAGKVPEVLSLLQLGMQAAYKRAAEYFEYNRRENYDAKTPIPDPAASVVVGFFDDAIGAAEEVIAAIDGTATAAALSCSNDQDAGKEALVARKTAEGRKSTLLEAWTCKAMVLLNKALFLEWLEELPTRCCAAGSCFVALEGDCYRELARWGEPVGSDASNKNAVGGWRLGLERLKRGSKWGAALKRVNDLVALSVALPPTANDTIQGANAGGKKVDAKAAKKERGGAADELQEEKMLLLRRLGWNHVVSSITRQQLASLVPLCTTTVSMQPLSSMGSKEFGRYFNGSF